MSDIHDILKHPIAHRGVYGDGVPENSLGSFRQAIEQKKGIECDVRILANGTAVVFHDRTLMRMTGAAGHISDCTQETIVNLRLDNSDEHIPLLCEVLDFVDGRAPIIIELKTSPLRARRDARRLAREIIGYRGPLIIASFSVTAVHAFKDSGFYTGQNFWHRSAVARAWSMLWWLSRGCSGDILAVPLCYAGMMWMPMIRLFSRDNIIFWRSPKCGRCGATPVRDEYKMFGEERLKK